MSALPALRAAMAEGRPAVFVRVEEARGSTPREVGAFMLVTADACEGTVGGGALEMEGIVEARRLLASAGSESRLAIPLGPAIGQCCGGHVTLGLRRLDAALLSDMEGLEARERAAYPHVYVFGAGHTGQALARALLPLPLQVVVIDTGAAGLGARPGGVARRLRAVPVAEPAGAPAGSGFVVLTHDHALDFLIAAEALRRADAAYVGMIGSRTKRETFRHRLDEAGEGALVRRLVLPIGGGQVRDKRPAVIAALAAAEILTALASSFEENRCSGFALAQIECHNISVEP